MKKILVTGANKGIGLGIVTRLISSFPDTFVFLGCRDAEKGRSAIECLGRECADWIERLCLLEMDVTDQNSAKLAASKVREDLNMDGTFLYAIVNNAGIAHSDDGVAPIIEVNTLGPKRVFEEFFDLIDPIKGRIVNVTSASGPNYLSHCDEHIRKKLTNQNVTWDEIANLIENFLNEYEDLSPDGKATLYSNVYGFSKACTNALTMYLASSHSNLIINSCTPGFIDTDLTQPYVAERGLTPIEMGMKKPIEGAVSSIHLLMEEKIGSGFYYGSDCVRSPLDRYRSPGDPAYQGD
tara:strand:- start:200 stop:1084 length:885 start_codon:yes stop_codon:yes gene_type:complete